METLWPYILPLPTKSTRQYKILLSVFKSKVSFEIMRLMPVDKAIYQKDLIGKLCRHSNKTVIEGLNRLVSAGVLEEGMEKVAVNDKNVWVKWYKPTFLGKWLVLLLIPPKQIPREKVEETIKTLFTLYIKNAVDLCKNYEVNPEVIKEIFEETYQKAI